MSEERYLSPAEFARASRVTIGYVYGLLAAGRLAAEKRGGLWAIDPSELERRAKEEQPV